VPLLVVQVEDAGSKGQISETDIGQAILILRDVLGTLRMTPLPTPFRRDGADHRRRDYPVPRPSDIEADPNVRVVFFKTSLKHWWDARGRSNDVVPRRSRLHLHRAARRPDGPHTAGAAHRDQRGPEHCCALPAHYDTTGLERVIAKLSSG